MSAVPRIAVVIVSYNSAGVLRGCLDSLRRQGPAVALDTVVVDNGSRDGTRALVRDHYPEVRLIEAPRNGGFSYGNNLGLHALGLLGEGAGGGWGGTPPTNHDYVLYLNPDTELPDGALGTLVAVLAARPRVGALSPRLVRADGSLDRACHRAFPTAWNALCHVLGLDRRWPHSRWFGQYNLTYLPEDQPAAVGCVAAAFMLVRAPIVRAIGPWDESFFAYGEDIDYCLRIQRAGWRIWYEPSVRVLHLKGEASRQRSGPMLRAFYHAMEVYYRKHHAARDAPPLRWAIIGGIRALYAAAYLRQRTRPAHERWVGAARPTR